MKKIVNIHSISQVHDFFGLDRPRHPLVSVIHMSDEIANYDFGDVHYRLDLYQVSLKLGITGSFNYGKNTYDFQEGSMIFIKPHQIINMDDAHDIEGSNGWTLVFHPDLIRKSELGNTIDEYTFFDYDVNEALHLSSEEEKSITEVVGKIEKEYSQNIDRHSQELIVANLVVLLKYCKRFYDRQFYTRTNLNKDIVGSFEKVVKAYFNSDKPFEVGVLTVGYCANQLNMSSNYLSDLLRSEIGKSAKEYIQDILVDKAKTKILGSNDAISEIAYSFGFEQPQSFNRLFKAKTGVSPSGYRRLN